MDDRIRAAERSGDRRRMLIELYRAGQKIEYQAGDVVLVTKYADGSTGSLDTEIRELIVGKEQVVTSYACGSPWPIQIRPKSYILILAPTEVEPA